MSRGKAFRLRQAISSSQHAIPVCHPAHGATSTPFAMLLPLTLRLPAEIVATRPRVFRPPEQFSLRLVIDLLAQSQEVSRVLIQDI